MIPDLTKRELFAAMAMHGWLSRFGGDTPFPDADIRSQIAKSCVSIAESLLAELDCDAIRPIGDLKLSVRARRCMRRLYIRTVGDLLRLSADDLLEQRDFGEASLDEIREKLRQLGLSLRDEIT